MNDRSKKYKIENHHSVNDGTVSARKLHHKFKERDILNSKIDMLHEIERYLQSVGHKEEDAKKIS